MPRLFLPRKSGAHRIACIALYRALLIQCPRIPLPTSLPSQGATNPIKHFIRQQFKRHIFQTSARLVTTYLKSGYAAESLLRSAGDGHLPALSQIRSLLWALHREREAARAACAKPTPRGLLRPRVWAYPGARTVTEVRPLGKEELSGRRRVPILTQGNGVPFLRFKREQSPFLGRVLRDKMGQKQARYRALENVDEGLGWARDEDGWDDVVGLREEGEEGWTRDLARARNVVYKREKEEQWRWVDRGEGLRAIAEREREMWIDEGRERRHEKKLTKWARRKSAGKEEASQEVMHLHKGRRASKRLDMNSRNFK